jgi:hypothetical protein
MNEQKFPLTLAAVKRGETSLWDIGDALIKECGPPGEQGAKNGSYDRVGAAQGYLAQQGYELSVSYLRMLRKTAFDFPKGRRQPLHSFSVHTAAGTPERLAALIKAAKGRPLSQHYIDRVTRAEFEAAKAQKLAAEVKARAAREKAEAKEREAERKLREAVDEKERAKAQKEADRAAKETQKAEREEREAKTAPPRKPVPLEDEEVPKMLSALEALSFAHQSEALAERAMKAVETELDQWDEATRLAVVEAILEGVNQWRAVAELVEGKKGRTEHLSVVAR